MKLKRTMFLFLFLSIAIRSHSLANSSTDINTILMRSTFKITGKGSTGTAFFIGKPAGPNSKEVYYVLVTAAHVLKKISGDEATLLLRKKDGDSYIKADYVIKIRDKGIKLWTTHPSADVAVMYVPVPKNADMALVSANLIANDEILEKFEIHPGDRLACLGYPLGMEGNEAGFPILRSGYIASYPLVPIDKVKTFLLDFNVFEGNSGGPVYFTDSNRNYGGSTHIGKIRFLVGLVSKQRIAKEQIRSYGEVRNLDHKLGLAIVIHGKLIKEAISMLPSEPQ